MKHTNKWVTCGKEWCFFFTYVIYLLLFAWLHWCSTFSHCHLFSFPSVAQQRLCGIMLLFQLFSMDEMSWFAYFHIVLFYFTAFEIDDIVNFPLILPALFCSQYHSQKSFELFSKVFEIDCIFAPWMYFFSMVFVANRWQINSNIENSIKYDHWELHHWWHD